MLLLLIVFKNKAPPKDNVLTCTLEVKVLSFSFSIFNSSLILELPMIFLNSEDLYISRSIDLWVEASVGCYLTHLEPPHLRRSEYVPEGSRWAKRRFRRCGESAALGPEAPLGADQRRCPNFKKGNREKQEKHWKVNYFLFIIIRYHKISRVPWPKKEYILVCVCRNMIIWLLFLFLSVHEIHQNHIKYNRESTSPISIWIEIVRLIVLNYSRSS